MCCKKGSLVGCLAGLSLVVLGVYLWYSLLDEDHKRFIRNILNQVPDLPGRYMI
jgi:hypothetical protein